MKGEKLSASRIFEFDGGFRSAAFYGQLARMCEQFDIPVPMVLPRHIKHFSQFNVVRFFPSDFVEAVDFSAVVIENAPEHKKEKTPFNTYHD